MSNIKNSDEPSICSQHQIYDPDCKLCNSTMQDLFPGVDLAQKHAEANIAGLMTCPKCEFEYYNTIGMCPKCSTKTSLKTEQTAKHVCDICRKDFVYFQPPLIPVTKWNGDPLLKIVCATCDAQLKIREAKVINDFRRYVFCVD